MTEYSYGVVVEDCNPGHGIWLLFNGIDSHLTQLDEGLCENLQVGAIVQARTDDGETRIRQSWPYPDSIWSDRKRVVVRTIVSYSSGITIDRGKWRDNVSGAYYVNLFSRDIGIVLAPTHWYNREFFDAGECHLFVYAEYGPRTLTSPTTWDESEFYWTIIEDRLSLPVLLPSKDQDADKFLEPDEIRKVPGITVQRQGNGMLVWSYGLGDRMAIILNGGNLDVGKWLTTTVIRSSWNDLTLHGCAYTVVSHDSAIPFTQPEVKVVNDKILMVLSLNRCEVDPGNPAAGVKLWHDFWGLPIGYDEEAADWIRGVEVKEGTFRGVVEIGLSEEAFEGRRVSVKAIGPAAAPRMGKSPLPPVATDSVPRSLEDLAALKTALLEEDRPEGARPIEPPTNERNDSNNNDDQWRTQDQTVSSAAILTDRSAQSPVNLSREWSGFGRMRTNDDYRRAVEMRTKEKEQGMAKYSNVQTSSWGEIPRKELGLKKKNTSNTSQKKETSPKRKEEQLNWKEWKKEDVKGKEKEKEKEPAKEADKEKEKEKDKDDLADKDWYVTFSVPPICANGLKGKGKNRGIFKDYPKYELRPKQYYGPGAPGYVDPTKVPPGGKVTLRVGSAVPLTPVPAAAEPPEKPPKSGFDGNIVGPIPIRAFDDKKTERKWKAEMTEKGWSFPKEREQIIIPDGEDGWDHMVCKEFGKTPLVKAKSPMPIEVLLNKRTIVRDAMRLKQRQCLITKVRFDVHWKDADRIQLFILDGTPAYIVHRMSSYLGNHSYLKNLPEFTTVGNIVELHVGRNSEGFYVHDEMWRLVTKINLPMREVIFEPGRVKTLELIVNCRCLGPDAQDRHNDRHRYDEKGFTMLNDEILHNIVYYGRNIDAREHDDYTFQITVEPDEVLDGHAFWKANDVHWRVMMEKIPDFDLGREPFVEKPTPPLAPRPPVAIDIKASKNTYENYALMYAQPCTVARETRLDELFALYGKLMENDKLMTELFTRTGTDYKKKFRSAIEVAQTAMPHKKSMKRELQINADFLISIVENAYSETIFREVGERRLWKALVKTSDSIKAFRSTVNNR